jgi:hypothetical protein
MIRKLQFIMQDGRKWVLTRKFNDEKHIDNFIDYVCRTKRCAFDEIWHVDA